MSRKTSFLFIVIALFFVSVNSLFAVPAVPWPVEKVQPDGTKISVYLRGDEKAHWMESLDGYTLMYDAQKFIVYADQDSQGNLVPTNIKFTGQTTGPTGRTISKGLTYSKSQISMFEQVWQVTSDEKIQRAPVTGSRKALCVLMDFSNRSFSKANSEFETIFNQVGLYPGDGSAKGSVRDFYRENSYEELDLTVTVVGPYRAPNTTTYYASDANYRAFATAAAHAADADVDFTEFATNGVLETFHIIFAGYGDEAVGNSQQIWSHKWQLATPLMLDGVRVSVYSCSPELRGSSGNNLTYIGVICHELCHVFGAPDYYDTGSTGYAGSGNWDLMANGSWNDNGRQPGHINMFQKILYGWVTPQELTSFTEVTDMPNSALNPVAYTITANETTGEMYVLENRQQVGFDGSVPGHGLLVWHVHPGALSGNGSNASHPQQLYPVSASSTVAIPTGGVASYGNVNSAGTPFPGTNGKTAFTAKTTPTMFTWTNSQPISKPLTDISESAGGGGNLISFKYLDGPSEPISGLQQEVTDANVKLTWTAPAHPEVLGYKIYRDGVLQYTINSKNTTEYTQIGVLNGTYDYCVTAFYEATESAKVCASVTVTGGSDTYVLPPTNLQANVTRDKAYLSWTRPFNGGWVGISGTATTVYSFDEEVTLFAGTLWEPEHLKGLDGYDLTQVQFYAYGMANGITYAVQVWTVENGVAERIHTQSYLGTTSNGLKTVTLTGPTITIDASKGYAIGVEIQTKVDVGCFVVDGNPLVPGRNFMIEEDGWYYAENAGIANNFILQAYLNSGNPVSPNVVLDSRDVENQQRGAGAFPKRAKSNAIPSHFSKSVQSPILEPEAAIQKAAPALTGYEVYRNGTLIGTTTSATSTTYDDTGLTSGTAYSYCVTAVYGSTGSSEAVCAEVTTLSEISVYNPVENLRIKTAGDEVTVNWDAPYSGGTIGYATATSLGTPASVNAPVMVQAIRFTPDDMKKWNGKSLTKVRFHSGSSTSVTRTYAIKVWSGGNGSTPGTLAYSYELGSYPNNSWADITLPEAVPVDVYQDLWIGIEVTRTVASGNIPLPRYQVAAVNGKSNLYYNGTNWTTYSTAFSWPISATLEPDASSPTLTGYKVARDDAPLTTLPATERTYKDTGVTPGTYSYCVTAVYDSGESNPECTTVAVEAPLSPYNPVENLRAILRENTAKLQWDAPFAGGTIGYCEDALLGAFALNATMAARFTREELKKMVGMQLTQVHFGISNASVSNANTSYTIRIYTGRYGDGPEAMIYEKAVPSFAAGWNVVDIDPIDINVYEDLWIGVAVANTGTSLSRATLSQGAVVEGKGNMIYYNNVWQTVGAISSSNYNWAIRGYVESGSGSGAPAVLSHAPFDVEEQPVINEPQTVVLADNDAMPAYSAPQFMGNPDGYALFRDGEPLATLGSGVLRYEDALDTTGEYNYCVVAQYGAGKESEAVCADVSFVSECDAVPTNVVAELSGKTVSIDWEFERVVPRQVFAEDFEDGIPAGWLNVDDDGDSKSWYAIDGGAHTGYSMVTSASYDGAALTPDNWLITPAITLTAGNTLKYYVNAYEAAYPAEKYAVYLSTTDTELSSFTVQLHEEILTASPGQPVNGVSKTGSPQYAPGTWYERSIDLSEYAGETVYIAFRHYDCTDEFRLNIDDVVVEGPVAPTFNIYQNDVLIAANVTGNHYEVELESAGTYNYCVSFAGAYCESEKVCSEDAVSIYAKDLFSVPTGAIVFAGVGSAEDVEVTITDQDCITASGFSLHYSAPDWITVTVDGNILTFTASANGTNALRSGTIRVWYGVDGSEYSANSGYEIAVSQKAPQSVTFEAPESLFRQAETYTLSATATSGLTVSFSLRAADAALAEITGNTLTLKQAGTILVTASQAGNADFEAATAVSREIVIIPDLTDLFSVPDDDLRFAGLGSEEEVVITFNDLSYIVAAGLTIQVSAPDWITVTRGNARLTFKAAANETNAFRSGVIRVWLAGADGAAEAGYGYSIPVSQKALQSIRFETPQALLLQEGTYTLPATATSGLPVSLSLRAEDAASAEITGGNILSLKQEGKILVTASVAAGNDEFEDTAEVSREIAIIVPDITDLFRITSGAIRFAAVGGVEDVNIIYSDPQRYISTYGLTLHISAPDWITTTAGSNLLTFKAAANETDAARAGVIKVWYDRAGGNLDPNYGYAIVVRQRALQTIQFEAPAELLLQDGTYILSATSTSGLPVSFSLRPEDAPYAVIEDGNILRMKEVGAVLITASVKGNDTYDDAASVSSLVLIQLSRTGIEDVAAGRLAVYPNPSLPGQVFYVASGLTDTELRNVYIDIYSLSGALIDRKKVTGKITEVSIQTSGIYVLRLKDEKVIVIIK